MSRVPSILWVARMRFFDDLRVREVELARSLATRARLVALDRSDARGWDGPHLVSKLRLRWEMARGGWATWDLSGLTRFRMPVLVGTGPGMNRVAARLNERRIARALERFDCGMVFHSHPFLFLPPPAGRRSYRAHFDLVDNFFDGYPDSIVGRSRRRFLRDAMLRADTLSAVSHCLCDRVEEFTGRRPVYVPNGAALDQIRSWPKSRAAAVRARHGLEGRRALVYVGNHFPDYDGMEMLLEAFLDAKAVRPDLELLIVGHGSDRVPRARKVGPEHGVRVVAPVPVSEVWDYFHAADLGLLPFVPKPVTNHSLPLKVLEFGAAGKPMLATPLDELKRLAFPHVRFAAYDRRAWRDALIDDVTYTASAQAELEGSMERFSWQAAADALMGAMGLAGA